MAFGCILALAGSNLTSSLRFYGLADGILFFVGVFAALSVFWGWSLSFLTKQHYRLFAIGTLFAIAYCCVPQSSLALCLVCFVLLTAAASCILASAVVLHRQIASASCFVERKDVSHFLLLRNLGFVAATVNVLWTIVAKFCQQQGVQAASVSVNVVGGLLLFVLLFTYLRQPLDFVTDYKLRLLQEDNDVDMQLVREQILDRLQNVQDYPVAMMLKKVLGMFVRCKTEGLEKVTESGACFVANHYEVYGPFITVLKFPLVFMPWTDNLITDRTTLTRQLRSGIEISTRKWLIKPIRRRLPKLVASPLWKTVNCARPIPIYRKGEEVEKMFLQSVEALKTGDSVMIYPEKPPEGENYKIGGVDKFQTGFVELAQYYKVATGKDMCFYPLYIDKAGKKMIVGDKVTYDSQNDLHSEKVKVSDELFEKMLAMSVQCENSRKKQK